MPAGMAKVPLSLITSHMHHTVKITNRCCCYAGIYFTSNIKYARSYATPNSSGLRYILVAFATPGNIYPVIEPAVPNHPQTLMGKPCRKGYQSHFVVVNGPTAQKLGHVAPMGTAEGHLADELVLFESAQAVPRFVLVIR